MSNMENASSPFVVLARERLARQLIEAGVPSAEADALALNGTYQIYRDDVVLTFGEKRALASQPETVTALAVHLAAARGKVAPDPTGADAARAAGKAAAAAQKRAADNSLAFK